MHKCLSKKLYSTILYCSKRNRHINSNRRFSSDKSFGNDKTSNSDRVSCQ
jgi:hypothetical protein